MWFIAIRYSGGYVDGYMASSELTPEEAIKDIKKMLIGSVKLMELKVSKSMSSQDTAIYNRNIEEAKERIQVFKHPYRKTSRNGSPVLTVYKVPAPVSVGNWIEDIILKEYAVNIYPKVEVELGTSS